VRIDEGLSARDRYAVGLSEFLDVFEIGNDLVERLVSVGIILAITAVTVDVALRRRLKPGNGVVGEIPGQSVVVVECYGAGRHDNPPSCHAIEDIS
jgi:hypothetical protein